MATQVHPEELFQRVQQLTERVDELPDPRARELAQELVATVMAMYGDGLGRIMAKIEGARDAGATILDELAQDGVVASLLLIHDLYPVPLADRVTEALDTVRPYMESHGGNVQLVELEDGVATLRLEGSCNGCAASRATLELAIKQALAEHCPDLAGLDVQGVIEEARPSLGAFELPVLQSDPTPASAPSDEPPARWVTVAEFARPPRDATAALEVDGAAILLADVDGSLLAYRDECASCGDSLQTGVLTGGMLACPGCGVEFDLPRVGRAAGVEPLALHPVPLLESGGLRVAVAG